MSLTHLGIYIIVFFHAILGHFAVELYYITTLLLTYFVIGIGLAISSFVLVIIWIVSIFRSEYEFLAPIADTVWIVGIIVVLVHVWSFRKAIRKNLAKTIMSNVNKRIDDLMFSNGEELDLHDGMNSDSQEM